MNKRTRAIDADTYKLIISTMKSGFEYDVVTYKSNERIATMFFATPKCNKTSAPPLVQS